MSFGDRAGIISRMAWTIDELYALPADGVSYEIRRGVLLSEPRPGTRHGLVLSTVTCIFVEFVRARRLGVVLSGDTGFILARSPDTVRGPDVAFVSRERFESVGDVPTAFPGPPDLAVEVLSPSDRPGALRTKVADYLAAGTRLVWIVDPDCRRVTVHAPSVAPIVRSTGEALDGGDVLPGFVVQVEELFQ